MADDTGREIHDIFDLVFKRLIQEASPQAVVALVNGLFGTDFPLDSPVSFPNTEKVTEDLRKIVSDTMIRVGREVLHLEAQIDNDLNIALRMFRYGYHEAVREPEAGEGGDLTITFPQARVLYWETTKKTPDAVTLHVIFPDRIQHDFVIPVFKVLNHEIEELEGKKLALLLPFYILKYRKQAKAARTEEERLALVPAVKETVKRLIGAVQGLREGGILTGEDEAVILGEVKILYSELYDTYEEFREAKVVLEERLENPVLKAKRDGKVEGRAEGKAEGKAEVAWNLLKAGVSKDIIIQATGLSIADIENRQRTAFSVSPARGN
jgi:hypothetical protein